MNAAARWHRMAWPLIVGMLFASCATNGRAPIYPEETASPPVPGKVLRNLPPTQAQFPVLGADALMLERLFGPPSLRRREPPAEYWRYDFPRCTLDLFLFQAPGEPAPRVVYFEFREQAPGAAMHDCREIEARFGTPPPPHTPGLRAPTY
jgi:hypothetical protein